MLGLERMKIFLDLTGAALLMNVMCIIKYFFEGTMNKGDLVNAVFAKAKYASMQVSKNDLAKIVDMFFNSIVEGIKHDEIVRIVGFGTWMRREKKGRKGRNPSTGKEIMIPARTDVKFSIGKQTKSIVNN